MLLPQLPRNPSLLCGTRKAEVEANLGLEPSPVRVLFVQLAADKASCCSRARSVALFGSSFEGRVHGTLWQTTQF